MNEQQQASHRKAVILAAEMAAKRMTAMTEHILSPDSSLVMSGYSARKERERLLITSDAGASQVIDRALYDYDSSLEEEEHGEKPPDHLTTNCQTLMHLLKGNIGTGVLAMPSAFKHAGILVGSVGIVIMGLICVHCMHILVRCNHRLSKKVGCRTLDFSKVAQYAFKLGPPAFHRLSGFARTMINIFLMMTQFGFCCVYFVFVATSIQEVVKNTTNGVDIGIHGYLAMVLPLMILYNFIRSLRTLAIASTVANFLQISGMVLIFYNLLTNIPKLSDRPMSSQLSGLPLYFGTAIYAFEGIGIVLPLENEMQTPQDFGGLNGVLNTGMMMVLCLYTAIGFFGYLKYGNDVKGSITLNFQPSPLNEVIRIVFAIAIFLSYALQLYVPVKIIWPYLKKKFDLEERYSPTVVTCLEYSVRTAIILLTFTLAAAIPELELFISLVGALASSSLALIIPPILELLTFWDEEYSRPVWIMLCIKNALITTFGIVGFVTGSYSSVLNIINK